jgi:hypothetical protein
VATSVKHDSSQYIYGDLELKKFSQGELLSGTADANSKVIAAFYALQPCGRGRIAQV